MCFIGGGKWGVLVNFSPPGRRSDYGKIKKDPKGKAGNLKAVPFMEKMASES